MYPASKLPLTTPHGEIACYGEIHPIKETRIKKNRLSQDIKVTISLLSLFSENQFIVRV
jgi:hypothetical protein